MRGGKYSEWAGEFKGCSDHDCSLKTSSGGMGTNGGCRCLRTTHPIVMNRMLQTINKLREELKEHG